MYNFLNKLFIFFRFPAAVLLAFWTLSGCIPFPKAPMDLLSYESNEGVPNQNLIVFLRGYTGDYNYFESEGLVDEVRKRHLPYDMVSPDAHPGYYHERTLIQRLKADVIGPAKNKGYRNIWLIGVSIGGMGSLLYLREYPEDISGVYVISPFLGYPPIASEIRAAGGLSKWEPGKYDEEKDWQRMLWHWLKTYSALKHRIAPIYMGYGENEIFAEAQNLMADILPAEHVYRIKGAHTYKTFKALWIVFLDDSVLE